MNVLSFYTFRLNISSFKKKCPNATEVERFKWAVGNGTINWHAVPMNFQVENVGSELFKFGLKLSQDLDKRFGLHRVGRVMSQRDVPGPILLFSIVSYRPFFS